jgi:hypothetical protein
MKLVNREVFLAMPNGTIYSKYQPRVFDDLCIKTSTLDHGDWIYIPLSAGFIKDSIAEEIIGDTFEFDLAATTRDGTYDESQIFAVYEKDDILKLISMLTYSFLEPDIEKL